MNTQLLTVTSTGSTHKTAKVAMTGRWLVPIGFDVGTKVKAIPVNHGMDFFLVRNHENRFPPEGKHLNVIRITYHKKYSYPALITSGNWIDRSGLSIGDTCVMKYTDGIIRIRKLLLPDVGFADKKHHYPCCFGSSFKQYTSSDTEYRLMGTWLTEYGFSYDVLLSVKAELGRITLECRDGGMQDYHRLVKSARQHRLLFLQVGKRGRSPCIGIPRQTLTNAGFHADDIFVACCEEGCIKLVAIPLEMLGFP